MGVEPDAAGASVRMAPQDFVPPPPAMKPRPFADESYGGDRALKTAFGHPRDWCNRKGPNVHAVLECAHGFDHFIPAYHWWTGWYWKRVKTEPRDGAAT